MQTGEGEATRLTEDGKPAYRVEFEQSNLAFDSKGIFAGSMQKVSGDLFGKGPKPTKFTADTGKADKIEERLELNGRIEVRSPEPPGVLRCDRLVWDAKNQRIQAYGNVRFDGEAFSLGPASEVWASPDLSTVATPEMYKP